MGFCGGICAGDSQGMMGGGLDQRKDCGSYLGGRIKVFTSDEPGRWGCLQRGGVLCSKVVLAGVCRNGGL